MKEIKIKTNLEGNVYQVTAMVHVDQFWESVSKGLAFEIIDNLIEKISEKFLKLNEKRILKEIDSKTVATMALTQAVASVKNKLKL